MPLPPLSPDEPSLSIGTKIPASYVARLDQLAARAELTRAAYIRKFVTRHIDSQTPVET